MKGAIPAEHTFVKPQEKGQVGLLSLLAIFVPRSLGLVVRSLLAVLGFLLLGAFGRHRRPALVRRYLQGNGGLFVKLGQIMALRYDLLPPAYCDELATLLDQLPAAPVEAIRRRIEATLGRSLD